MKKKSKLISTLLVCVLCISFMHVNAIAQESIESEGLIFTEAEKAGEKEKTKENIVAKTNDRNFESLDEAIDAVQKGETQSSTIEIMKDCSTSWEYGQRFLKSMVVNLNGHSISFSAGFCIAPQAEIKFINGIVNMNGIELGKSDWSDPTPGKNKIAIVVNPNATFTVENSTLNITQSAAKVDGIYLHASAIVNFRSSDINICDNGGNGITQDNGDSYLNISDSNVKIERNKWNGITGPQYINANIINSKVNINNNLLRGVHCGKFTLDNSTLNALNNGSDGLNLNQLCIKNNSVINSQDNGANGIRDMGEFTVDGTCQMNITGNAKKGFGAGLRLSSKKDIKSEIQSGAIIKINNNHRNGLENYRIGKGTLIEEGVNLEIMGNCESNNGGGIYNNGVLSLPSNAKIYNNHAKKSGDDIYSDGTITLGKVGEEWRLDGVNELDPNNPGCQDLIDGWYVDNKDLRWEAHQDPLHIEEYTEFTNGLTTVSGPLALKAAHNLIQYTVTINFLEENTNKVLETAFVTTPVREGESYDVSEYQNKQIKDYVFVRSEGDNFTGTLDENKVINLYYKHLNKYKVNYEFVSGTKDKKLPQEVSDLLPFDTNEYNEGLTVKAKNPNQIVVKVKDGVWTFKGYDKDTKIINNNIVFKGTWVYEENETVVPIKPNNPDNNIDIEKPEESLDKPEVLEKPENTNSDKVENTEKPNTGASTNTVLLWTVVLGAGAVAVLLANKKRKAHR